MFNFDYNLIENRRPTIQNIIGLLPAPTIELNENSLIELHNSKVRIFGNDHLENHTEY